MKPKRTTVRRVKAYAVLSPSNTLIFPYSKVTGETDAVEIHKTLRLAEGAAFKDETVVGCTISYSLPKRKKDGTMK